MTKTKGQIGSKDGSDHARLSSDERARHHRAAEVSDTGASRVKVVAVEAHCGIHQRPPFLLYLERKDGGWEVQRLFAS
jgi:hypothetical protein